MALSIEAFQALPMKQRVGAIAGIGFVIALAIGYMLYSDLGKLGNDPDNLLSFMMRDTDDSLWTEIKDLDVKIAGFNQKAAQLKKRQADLAVIMKTIAGARQQLPADREDSKVTKELEDFATTIVQKEVGNIAVKSINIRQAAAPTGRRGRAATGVQPLSTVFVCNLDADLNGLLSFINKVERSNRFMTVDTIKLKPGKVDVDTKGENPEIVYGNHSVVLEINTWVLQE